MVRETSYSLGNLEAALEDALSSDCTPEEIYETIRTTLRRNLTYHRVCVRTANEVLRSINGINHKDKVISLHERELDVTLTDFPDYTELPDVDRSFIDSERNNEENPMSYQDMIDAGYEMTGEGIWWPKEGEPLPEVTPDYNNPRVCAEIDSRGGDNRS